MKIPGHVPSQRLYPSALCHIVLHPRILFEVKQTTTIERQEGIQLISNK